MKSKIFALCASFTLMLAGCGPEPVKATGVELDKTSATMIVGDTLQLKATVAPENATDKAVTWSASGDGIVKVEDGLVTALKAGESTVTVTTHDGGFTATCAITVNNPVVHVTGVELDKESETVKVASTLTLVATVSPSDATDKSVTWSSSEESVAVVSDAGVVTAKKAGTATITATTTDGSKSDSCLITVPQVAYPEGTFMGEAQGYKLTVAIGNETNKLIAVRLSTAEVSPTGIAFDKDEGKVSIPTTGSITVKEVAYSYGEISGIYDEANDKLINVNFSGDVKAMFSNVELTRPTDAFYDFNKDTAGLQAQFKRRYRNNNAWNVDTSNTDRIVANTTNMASGSAGLTVRPCTKSYQGYCFNLQSDYAETKTLSSLQFWVYNPCSTDIKMRIYYFKQTGLNGAGQVGLNDTTDVVKANSWTYISRGFGSNKIYNFSLSVWTEDQANTTETMSAKLVFDDLLFF